MEENYFMEQTQTNDFLEKESLGRLMVKYAVPCVISLLVAALYNIVDQIFIANASYLGSYGNAANTVVFPLTVVALSIAMMKQTGKIVVKFQRRGKPTNSALLESHYQSEHLQDIGISRPICCYTSK